jgi:hypothetical protein
MKNHKKNVTRNVFVVDENTVWLSAREFEHEEHVNLFFQRSGIRGQHFHSCPEKQDVFFLVLSEFFVYCCFSFVCFFF